jgi:hypothetical protein
MKRTLWLVSSLVALTVPSMVFVACGGSDSTKPKLVAVKEKGRAVSKTGGGIRDKGRCEYVGRKDREVSEVAGTGSLLPNIRRVYQVIGTGADRRKVLACREVDTNLDGVKDVVRTYNETGEALHEEADRDYNGVIDTWITFASGRIIELSIDINGDGRPDQWKHYRDGKIYRVQIDTNKDGKPDVWEFYSSGHLERIGRDLNFDGKVDQWDHDELGAVASKSDTPKESPPPAQDAGTTSNNNGASTSSADAGTPPKK